MTDVIDLRRLVYSEFPTINFPFGDVISFAGKVAVETAFPCIRIKWRYGRTPCTDSTEKEENPPGTLDSIAQLRSFLARYGLTDKEMAVLTAGAHGIATASADQQNSGFGNLNFGFVNSGKKWIESTLNLQWEAVRASCTDFFQFVSKGSSPKKTVLRLPSDMVFFPRVIQKIGSGNVDQSANGIQDYLEFFTKVDRSVFDNEFAAVYAKMLEIGAGGMSLHTFVEPNVQLPACSDSPKHYPENNN